MSAPPSPALPSLAAPRGARDRVVPALTAACAFLIVAMLGIILAMVGIGGWERLSWEFLTTAPRNGMSEGGIFPAIFGTSFLVLVMTVAVIPLGVTTAIWLHEYARPGALRTRAIRLAVHNLAGVPSIVFGLFGLGFFVHFVGGGVDEFLYGGQPVYGKPGILWAALTMALLTLPVVIVATEEALRAVPDDHRRASLALGATRLQTVLRVVLPQAVPGILTGGILAVSRGAGEVAPILFTGAAYYLPRLPTRVNDQFMHMGYHVYVLATQSPDVEKTRPLLFATVLALLALTFLLNLAAVLLRVRLRRAIRR